MYRILGSPKGAAGLLTVLACFVLPDRVCAQFARNNTSMFPPGFQLHFSYNALPGLPTQQGANAGFNPAGGGGLGFGNPLGNPFGFGFGNPFAFGGFPPPLFQAARMARQPLLYQQQPMMFGMYGVGMYGSPSFGWSDPYSSIVGGFAPLNSAGFGAGFPNVNGND
jgi:hypothetical protein